MRRCSDNGSRQASFRGPVQSDAKIDLLISDVGLPGGMSGKEMVDAARISRPKIKVLFITGYADNAAITNGHVDPGVQVMSKPFSMEKLAARIRSIIEDRKQGPGTCRHRARSTET